MKNALYVTTSVMTLLGICLMLASMPARAGDGGNCVKLEYVELESLTKEQLLAMRCQYIGRAVDGAMTPKFDRCMEEVERMDRLLIVRYRITGDEPRKQIFCSKPMPS